MKCKSTAQMATRTAPSMGPSTTLLRAVQDAVRRVPGSYVAPGIEAMALPGMGVGVVARERIPKDTLVFRATQDAWFPFSAEFALRQAQQKAPGFVQQLNALFASSVAFRDSSSFVPNALMLGTHLAMSAPVSPTSGSSDASLTDVYTESLPEFVDLPFYWDEQQFQALDGCHEVRQSIQQSAQFYFQLYQHLFGTDNQVVPAERFFWSISVLMSRATSGKAQPFTLIPFFDWFNHSDNGDECVQAYDSQTQSFVVHATKEYAPGEQLFINYGAHGNSRLLRNYGFTIASNPHDSVSLVLPAELQQLDPNDGSSQDKSTVLSALGLTSKLKAVTLGAKGELAASSRAWLQMRLADANELQAMVHQASHDGADKSQLALPESLEQKVNGVVDQLGRARLKQHKISIEHDEEFLAMHSWQMAPWLRGAMHIRLSEKQILTKALSKSKSLRWN